MCVHYTCIVILVIVVVTLPSVGHTALLFENDLAALATGYIIVIVDHGCAAVACLGIIRLAEFRGHRTELAVDHHVVDHVHQGVLLHIDAATLLAVTSPTGVDDGVVVGVDLGHATCLALSGAGKLEAVGVGAEHEVARYISHATRLHVDCLGTVVSIGRKDVVGDDGLSTHQVDTVRPTVAQDRVGHYIASVDVVGRDLRIGIVACGIDTLGSCGRTLYHLSTGIFYHSMVDQQLLASGGSDDTTPQSSESVGLRAATLGYTEEHRLLGGTLAIEVAIHRELNGHMVGTYALLIKDYLHTLLNGEALASRHY